MTTGPDTLQPPPATPAEPKPNPFQRIIGVLFSPDETFASIARRPDWVVPLVILMIMSLAGGMVMAQHVDFGAPAREAMEQNKNVKQEQIDRAVKMGVAIGKVISYAAPVFTAIFFLICAGILLLAFRLMGGEGDYKQAFSALCYAWIPSVIKSVILLIVIVTRGGIISATALQTIVRTNLGFLFDLKTQPMAFTLAASLDIFTIWILVLTIIGFAHLSRVSKTKSAVIVICLWLVGVMFKLIGPAMQALRSKA